MAARRAGRLFLCYGALVFVALLVALARLPARPPLLALQEELNAMHRWYCAGANWAASEVCVAFRISQSTELRQSAVHLRQYDASTRSAGFRHGLDDMRARWCGRPAARRRRTPVCRWLAEENEKSAGSAKTDV